MSQPQQQAHTHSDASAITLLLADHEAYGFSERACYHFDLIETLTQTPQRQRSNTHDDTTTSSTKPAPSFIDNNSSEQATGSKSHSQEGKKGEDIHKGNNKLKDQFPNKIPSSCGVVSILECITQNPIKNAKRRRRLTRKIRDFNINADKMRKLSQGKDYCHQPNSLPLQLNFDTRVSFAYELTRMVFCIDASPTLTATFGNFGTGGIGSQKEPIMNDGVVCAIDRIEYMSRLFFRGLVQPIKGISKFDTRTTVNQKIKNSSTEEIIDWSPRIAVTVVACYPKTLLSDNDDQIFSILVSDYHIHDLNSANVLCDRMAAWIAMEVESVIAEKQGRTGGRLDSTTSSLEHIIETCHTVDATTLPPRARPCFVIATDCRAIECASVMDIVKEQNLKDVPLHVLDLSCGRTHPQVQKSQSSDIDMMFDYDGPSSFPLSISDDYEALFNACKSTRGYFLDIELLKMAVTTIAGEVPPDSPFIDDFYFSVKRRTTKPNALQWYIAFCLSPFCLHKGLPPVPRYFPSRKNSQRASDKITCLMYHLKPIRIKSILILRIMDGFRTWKYGSNSQDPDKVSIQFTLNVEGGTVIKYEISYHSSPFHNAMVGNAIVKIIIVGEASFIKLVQEQFYSMRWDPTFKKMANSAKDLVLNKMCDFMKDIRDEDLVESKICPLDWGDKLTKGSDFLTNLGMLKQNDIYRHFRCETFEVILIQSDNDISASNEKKLIQSIAEWSTQLIRPGELYLKLLPTTAGNMTNYCLVEYEMPNPQIRVSKVSMHFFEQVDVEYRFQFLASLQKFLEAFSSTLRVLPRIVSMHIKSSTSNSLSPPTSPKNDYSRILQCQSWDLLSDPELFPLITQQRSEVDLFCPIMVTPQQVLFVKFIANSLQDLCLVQYSIEKQQDKVHVSLSMDCNKADFSTAFSRFSVAKNPTLFSDINKNLIEKDQLCAGVLRSRRQLLNLFNVKSSEPPLIRIDQSANVDRLLSYANKYPIKLRFFDERSAIANDILEKMTIDFILTKARNVEVTELMVGKSKHLDIPGKWFLVRADSNTLGILHFPSKEQGNDHCLDAVSEKIRLRELTMFVISTMRLYSTNDSEVQSYKSSALEYPEKISLLSDQIEKAHGQNFALASYLALRNSTGSPDMVISATDFDYVLSYCNDILINHDVEIMSSFEIDGEHQSFGEKLVILIEEILMPVPIVGENGASTYFYFHGHLNQNFEIDVQLDSSVKNIPENEPVSQVDVEFNEPIFVSFTLDGKAASLEDLCKISSQQKQSSILNTFITSFKQSPLKEVFDFTMVQLPRIQHAVASDLTIKLNSFVAEQTMERLRMEHKATNGADFDNVKKCLLEAENVVASTIPVHFYFSKTDTMIDTSTSIGMEGDFQSKYALLNSCISGQNRILFREVSIGEFFAVDVEEFGWCFIQVPESFGFVSIYCYHPAGIERADEVTMIALKVISDACHITNQNLLLEHMHKTRAASSLIIPEHNVEQSHSGNPFNFRAQESNILDYPSGYFQCEISYQTSFQVHKRCQVSNVIHELESSVLHNFALSNRPGIFVYKDVDECIFYMKLQKGKDRDMETVELIVYGIHKAGSSITVQLKGLLQKKLMTLCTEAISRVLTKNPQFHLLDSDMQFIRNYSSIWKDLVEDCKDDSNCEQLYSFPLNIIDPVMILVYFRQNIIGSTFFNYVSETDQKESSYGLAKSSLDQIAIDKGIPFEFNQRDFSFYYNASQFLSKDFQPISTLTEVGKKYSRIAGTGVAIIELHLLDSKCQPLRRFRIGIPGDKELPADFTQLKFNKLTRSSCDQSLSNFHLSVRIINTTLNTSALHGWIELTLNQALLSWATERFLERSTKASAVVSQAHIINFGRIMRQSFDLPHPAVKKVCFRGDLKSTEMSKLVFYTLDNVFKILFSGKRRNIKDIQGLQTFLCQGRCSRLVQLISTTPQNPVQTVDLLTNELIPDHPAIDPQYVSSFGLCDASNYENRNDIKKNSFHRVPDSSFLFQRVRLFTSGSPVGTLSNALEELMQTNPTIFLRRIAFLLVVTRKSTTLYSYNWNPQAFDSIVSSLQEIFYEFSDMQKSTGPLLKNISPPPEKSAQPASSSKSSSSILMPTIVGKSVKGSAIQAVAMSRARARASRSNSSRPVMTTKSTRSSLTAPKPAQNVMPESTWKARKNKRALDPIKAQENEMMKSLPSSLAKEYMAFQSSILKNSISIDVVPMLYQRFFISWLSKVKENEIPLAAIEFILTHANLLGVQTFALLQFFSKNHYQFLTYLIEVMLSQDKSTTILAKNFSRHGQKDKSYILPILYIMRRIDSSSKKRSMIVIHEICIIGTEICRYRSWSLITCDEARKVFDSIFDDISLTNLNIKGEVFNYTCATLRKSLQYHLINSDQNISSTLRAAYHMFPSQIQSKTQLKNWFRLYHCKLLWEAAHDFTSANQFIEYVARYPSHYEVVSFCSGDTKCMGGKVMKSEDYEVHFFLVPSTGNGSAVTDIAFDLFIIVSAVNNILNVDQAFFEQKSRYYQAKKVVNNIYDASKKTVLSIINMASVDFRRDQMWEEQSDWV